MKTFKETDVWLIKNWGRARELEKSMDQVREGYRVILERSVERVKSEFPQFKRTRTFFESSDNGTQLGFGKVNWPVNKWGTTSGFWIYRLELDNLLADDGEPICSSVWIANESRLEIIRSRIKQTASKVLRRHKIQYFDGDEEDPQTVFRYDFPQSPQRRRKMLLERDGEEFIECIITQIAILTGFEPLLDKFCKRQR